MNCFSKKGFTLVEFVIVIALATFIFLSLIHFFLSSSFELKRGQLKVRLQRMGDICMEEMAREIRKGALADVNLTGDRITVYDTAGNVIATFERDGMGRFLKNGVDFIDRSGITVKKLYFEPQGSSIKGTISITMVLNEQMDPQDLYDDEEMSFFTKVNFRNETP